MLIMPLGDIFIEAFDIEAYQYSRLVSAYAFAAFLSAIVSIFYLDRFDRKKSLLFIYSGFIIGTILCAFANSYELLLTARFLTGMFGGIMGALILAIISDLFQFEERGYAMGVLMSAFSAAAALGIPFGIYLAAKGSWQLPFKVIGYSGIFINLMILIFFPSITSHLKDQSKSIEFKQTLLQIFSDQNQVRALIAGFVLVLGHFLIIPFISPYMIKNVGLEQIEISYQFFFGGLATIITGPFIGKLTDRFGVQKMFLLIVLISIIPTLIITNLGPSTLVTAIAASVFFFVFASGRFIPANAIITAATGTKNRGSFLSMKSSLQQLAIALASLFSGLIVTIENDSYIRYPIVGVLSVLICISSIYFLRKLNVADGN